ncbi:hypothetical protein HELRODRAFT_79051 [Helobdella robusta]|uniref:MalT-like TPR region domain-containing protein n=1 Tax=Helobdella robusta TaxID=6412 RepID=T1G3J4_HELRO|nr:hypothetical protein HELRODRAFT_79051 [Helobdella robusta]ESO04778.1 hypothetical protein HELRODRAFT_79051 [Helobdella robusta]
MESTSELQKTCLQLALEGERFCGQGDCKRGVQLFETALQVGTSDLDTLSAIYTELGNAYFVLHQYREALKYYNYDLNLARMMRDRANEGKAYSNLSIALKALNLFEEAFACCQHQLKIYKETADLAGEAKAYYNTGNVHYAVAKQSLVNEIEVQGRTHNSLLQAIHNYKLSIEASKQVKEDSSLLGRCYGNVGNALYLLGEFKEAILYHKKRLKLACLHGDLEAQKRAHTNLGNCCIFSRRFQTAITHYEACLTLSQQIGDKAMEAQAHYNLGCNAYSLIGKLKVSLKYHQEHLVLAKLLKDKMGEMRAWWSLSDVYSRMEDPDNAQHCYNCYYQLSSSQVC